jgi:hypothetical protein
MVSMPSSSCTSLCLSQCISAYMSAFYARALCARARTRMRMRAQRETGVPAAFTTVLSHIGHKRNNTPAPRVHDRRCIPVGTRHQGMGAASLFAVTVCCKRFAYTSARVSRPFASPPVSRPIYTCVDAAAPPFGCRAAAPTLAHTLAPTVAPTSAPTLSPTPSSPTGWPSPLASKYLPITNPSSDILCSCALACSYPCTERSANVRAHALTHTLTDALTDALIDGFALPLASMHLGARDPSLDVSLDVSCSGAQACSHPRTNGDQLSRVVIGSLHCY